MVPAPVQMLLGSSFFSLEPSTYIRSVGAADFGAKTPNNSSRLLSVAVVVGFLQGDEWVNGGDEVEVPYLTTSGSIQCC